MRFPAARIFAALLFAPTACLAPSSFLSVSFPSACRADTPPVQDIFVGGGTPGPFALSWNNVQLNTETVAVNQQAQLRGLDYTLDADAGTVTFTHPLPASAAIEVTYSTLPSVSQRTGRQQTVPLSVDLLRDQHRYFSLDALGTAAGNSDNLTVGAGLGWHGGANDQISSRFVYTPIAASASGTAPAGDRTGISLSGTAGAGQWGVFSAGFSRAGAGADTGSDSSFQSGREVVTLGSTLTPSKIIQAKLSFSRSDALGSTANAASTSLALALTPTDKTKVQADLAETSAGANGTLQTTAVSVDTQATKSLAVSADFHDQNQPGTAGDSQTLSLKTVLTPSNTYSLQTSADQSRLGTATTDQQSVTLALNPKSTVQLSAGFSMRQKLSEGADTVQTSEATAYGSLHPLPMLEITGSYKSRLAPASDTNPKYFDTSAAQVAFTPIKTFKLTGTYSQNPEDGTDTLQHLARRGVGLETSFGALGLSGGCDWSRTYGTPDAQETIHAALGLRFSNATQLSVTYQTQQDRLDASVPLATAYTVGFTHTLGDRFSLSLTGKRQQSATAASPNYNAAASLGMKF